MLLRVIFFLLIILIGSGQGAKVQKKQKFQVKGGLYAVEYYPGSDEFELFYTGIFGKKMNIVRLDKNLNVKEIKKLNTKEYVASDEAMEDIYKKFKAEIRRKVMRVGYSLNPTRQPVNIIMDYDTKKALIIEALKSIVENKITFNVSIYDFLAKERSEDNFEISTENKKYRLTIEDMLFDGNRTLYLLVRHDERISPLKNEPRKFVLYKKILGTDVLINTPIKTDTLVRDAYFRLALDDERGLLVITKLFFKNNREIRRQLKEQGKSNIRILSMEYKVISIYSNEVLDGFSKDLEIPRSLHNSDLLISQVDYGYMKGSPVVSVLLEFFREEERTYEAPSGNTYVRKYLAFYKIAVIVVKDHKTANIAIINQNRTNEIRSTGATMSENYIYLFYYDLKRNPKYSIIDENANIVSVKPYPIKECQYPRYDFIIKPSSNEIIIPGREKLKITKDKIVTKLKLD